MIPRRILFSAIAPACLALATPGIADDACVPPDHGRRPLERYASDTWRSFEALVDADTGLPADSIAGDLSLASRSRYTSPTNIAMYLWATLGARDLHLISARAATARLRQTLRTLGELERHGPSGQFYNWYDPATLEKLTTWPEPPNDPVYPFLSSVDNGWLASALLMVANAVPALHDEAWSLATSMDFSAYYDPLAKGADAGPGLLRGGFWRVGEEPPGSEAFPRGDYAGLGEEVVYTGHHYGSFNTETRIASYVAIALGQVPREHYFAAWRTFPDTCDWSWQEAKPVGRWQSYLGVDVFEGAYADGAAGRLVPTWGGSMFEALMPTLVVPEAEWAPNSWAVTHPLYVAAQVDFGLERAGYGYWGFSPSSDPAGGYREYGVDAIGMEPNGYTTDVDRSTLFDAGWDDAACSRPAAPIASFGDGVVTPHAAFLALAFAPAAALDNLARLQRDFPGLYGAGGFKDAVNVASGQIADRYLALDQGMVLAAAVNALTGGSLQRHLGPALQAELEPLMRLEAFGVP
ncbi:MAG TPA: glucoamylase family protein [Polyangiaceae bacterium]|nr:glucoamylase family protein [Polyangiaceae bacterium]